MRALYTQAVIVCALALLASRASAAGLRGLTFVVDPGHGTRYPSGAPLNVGAVGPDGIAERLARLLRAAGARPVLTRTLQRPFRIATDKRRDNRARAALANRIGAAAFVAIHADASLDRTRRGTSVFWLRPNSLALAVAVRRRLRPLALGEAQFRARDLAVTNEARVPAVLVEIGFISNPQQEHLLNDPVFQERVARALFAALGDAFGTHA
jgi:N-acetylmuramoyl-L-alanine amidase